MTKEELEALASTMADVVQERVDAAILTLVERIAVLEARQPEKGADGTPGKDGSDGRDGKDADPITAEQIAHAVLSMPEAISVAVEKHLSDNPPVAGKDGKDGADGKGADPVEVTETIRAEVEKAILAIPKPQDGKSVTLDDLRPMIDECVSKAVTAIPKPTDGKNGVDGKDGRDGLDVKDLLVVENGDLVATFSDGRSKNLGPFRGKQGDAGRDGVDGLGFDDMDAAYDGERTISLKFSRGEKAKKFSFSIPVVLDRGVYKEGQSYQAGDAVTWAGCLWIAQEDTTSKPDTGKSWRLSVKRGRDGKDAVVRTVVEKPVVKVG